MKQNNKVDSVGMLISAIKCAAVCCIGVCLILNEYNVLPIVSCH